MYEAVNILNRLRRPIIAAERNDKMKGMRQSTVKDYFAGSRAEYCPKSGNSDDILL